MAINNTNKMITPYTYNFYVNNWSNLDALYGPWNSFKEMIDKVTCNDNDETTINAFKNTIIPIGLTVGIYENDKVVEYWNPVEGQGFVKKTNGEGGATVINVTTYDEAITYATTENIGKTVYVSTGDEKEVYIVTEKRLDIYN